MNKFRSNRDIECNLPYEIKPPHARPIGVLLIHGLLDTPFIMKDIGNVLANNNLQVRSLLLPGHGQRPENLLDVQYKEWLETVKWAIESFATEVNQVFIVGFSTGAISGLHHALNYPKSLAGIVMLAPVFKIRSLFAFASNWHKLISHKWPKLQWLNKSTETDYTKYSSLPFNGVYQVYQLAKDTLKLDKNALTCPIFMILSKEDCIVSSKVALKYFHQLKDSRNRALLYTNASYLTTDSRITVRSGENKKWKIESISHIALPIRPTNPHYGMNGDLPAASHVEQTTDTIYGAYDKTTQFFYALLYKFKLTRYKRARLTFNPDFEYMAEQIQHFIDTHSS